MRLTHTIIHDYASYKHNTYAIEYIRLGADHHSLSYTYALSLYTYIIYMITWEQTFIACCMAFPKLQIPDTPLSLKSLYRIFRLIENYNCFIKLFWNYIEEKNDIKFNIKFVAWIYLYVCYFTMSWVLSSIHVCSIEIPFCFHLQIHRS